MTEVSEEEFKEHDTLIKDSNNEMGGLCSRLLTTKSSRLSAMLLLIIVYFFAEITVGHLSDSLTLIADSFHMLSDGIALTVGLVAVRMSKRTANESIQAWPSKQQYFNTFGWVRFEVVGALINATFLLALCISILMEAIEKFYEPKFVSKPELVLAVGAGGLLINICGLVMFGSHSHAGHDHDHGHDHHNHKHPKEQANGNCKKNDAEGLERGKTAESTDVAEAQMNMKAVFLHVLGDALGSVIVMISATIVILVPHNNVKDAAVPLCNTSTPSIVKETNHENHWIVYLDPVMSILLVVIMVTTTVPLFKKSSLILLQTVPKHVSLDSIKEKIDTIEGIQEFHDFHIWQLAGDKYVATVHVQCSDSQTYIKVAKEMKLRLHNAGIHSLTIQPEFKESPSKHCSMGCESNLCKNKVCCEIPVAHHVKKTKANSSNHDANSAPPSNNSVNVAITLDAEDNQHVHTSLCEAPETVV